MPELTTDGRRVFDRETGRWQDRPPPARWAGPAGVSPGWLLAGVAVAAVGVWAWYHFGPDFRRYVKMERM